MSNKSEKPFTHFTFIQPSFSKSVSNSIPIILEGNLIPVAITINSPIARQPNMMAHCFIINDILVECKSNCKEVFYTKMHCDCLMHIKEYCFITNNLWLKHQYTLFQILQFFSMVYFTETSFSPEFFVYWININNV